MASTLNVMTRQAVAAQRCLTLAGEIASAAGCAGVKSALSPAERSAPGPHRAMRQTELAAEALETLLQFLRDGGRPSRENRTPSGEHDHAQVF